MYYYNKNNYNKLQRLEEIKKRYCCPEVLNNAKPNLAITAFSRNNIA